MTLQSSSHHYSPIRVVSFLSASVSVHAMILWCVMWLPVGSADEAIPVKNQSQGATELSSVRMLDESSLPEAMRLARKPREKKKEPPKPKPKTKTDDQLPYVVQDTLIKAQDPDKARFSGKQAQRTKQDTQRKAKPGSSPRSQPLASKIVKGNPSGVDTPTQPKEVSDTQQTSTNTRAELESRDVPPDVILPGGPTAKSAPDPSDLVSPQSSSLPRRGREEGADTGKSARQNLFPTSAQSSNFVKEFGDGGTFHYLEDVDEGDVTMLNQKQNRYWSFWDRLIRQVRKEWNPGKEYRQRDPYGNIYGKRNFYSRVAVTLNFDGSVNKLRVVQSSGVEFMDDEAVRALLDAGPYPNPPEGMKDEDGLIHFKFGFLLEVTSGKVRLFNIKPEEPF